MKKIFGLIAAAAFVASAGFASAADAPKADASKAQELTQVEMDAVSAGIGASTTSTTSYSLRIGNLVFVINRAAFGK